MPLPEIEMPLVLNVADWSPINARTVLLESSVTAKSVTPSPLKSPTAAAIGATPAISVTCG